MLLEGQESAITWQGCDILVRPLITGTRGVARQFFESTGRGADHDRVEIARQHARGVGDGFAAAELEFGAREHDASPPSSHMPTSKDTRVRVEGLSKIMPRNLPASGLSRALRPPTRAP